ncbi:hypothetical protein AB0L04_12820 [Streptomyces glaucescens]
MAITTRTQVGAAVTLLREMVGTGRGAEAAGPSLDPDWDPVSTVEALLAA